jgi:hypothetical protein
MLFDVRTVFLLRFHYICSAMEFTDYLISKKIDPISFQKSENATFEEWKSVFEQVSPASFTAQKLFLINQARRKYPFSAVSTSQDKPTGMAKPKIVIKPKTN